MLPRIRWRWFYLLVAIPFLTDAIEEGHLPRAPIDLVTEASMAVLIAAGVSLLGRQSDRLAVQNLTDSLTGLGNRRRFDADLAREVPRARGLGRPLTLAFLDLDDFKSVNDRFGHDAGDALLRNVAAALESGIRCDSDAAYRLGGDEFALLLPGAAAAEAREVLDRIRSTATRGPGALLEFGAGVSVGVVELGATETTPEFYKRADAAMYEIKKESKTARRPRPCPSSLLTPDP
ncbi:MAG: GGDEF domain-containing protein [Planctomycetes bacterium]|nr:GGDEF domain-containing protein [Planctomycetota bacterium]